MKCVILAAGEGKRVHPLTFTRPKVMIPIANKPILEWNILNAIDAGIKEFIFVVSYKSEMVRSYFGKGEKWNVKIEYVYQGEALGTAHAIGVVEKFVDDFIVLCGDTIFSKEDYSFTMSRITIFILIYTIVFRTVNKVYNISVLFYTAGISKIR